MKFIKLSFIFAFMAFIGIIVMSCNDTTSPTTTNPVITSYDPVAQVGDTITINGTDFGVATDPGSVKFNTLDAPAANYISWTDTKIIVIVPSGATSGKMTVIANSKTSNEVDFVIGPKNPEPPTNLQATSLSATSVKIKFDLAPADKNNWAAFKDYQLYVTGGSPINPITIAKGINVYTATGLQEGIVYTFTLKARYSNNKESIADTKVLWSPATRFIETDNGTSINVYETPSSLGSGLQLYNATGNAPSVVTVANGSQWCLGLDTRTSGKLIFGSASEINYNYSGTPMVVEVSDKYFDGVSSLDDVFDSEALSTGNFTSSTIDLNALNSTGGVVLIVRVKNGADWNYAKVLIKMVGGNFLQGASPNRYIECNVSYQKTANVPYAKFGGRK
jgi:hypothetical protein